MYPVRFVASGFHVRILLLRHIFMLASENSHKDAISTVYVAARYLCVPVIKM